MTLSAPTIPPKLAQPSRVTVSNTGVPESSDNASAQFPEVATLESGQPLKTVFVSNRLREVFLTIAKPNTDRNLETCGILAGSCRNNAYFVTHLIIPKQESTSDTCATTDEEGLFNLQDENELFTIGWIHVSLLCPVPLSRSDRTLDANIPCSPMTDTPNANLLPQLRRPAHAHVVPDHASRGGCRRLQSVKDTFVGRLSRHRSSWTAGAQGLQAEWTLSSTCRDPPLCRRSPKHRSLGTGRSLSRGDL